MTFRSFWRIKSVFNRYLRQNVVDDIRQHKISVGLVACGGTDTEWQAIRAVLESFGARVFLIGRPNDFINVINGSTLYADIQHLIISAHGENGAFLVPELAEDVYMEKEPRVIQFDATLIEQHAIFNNLLVLTTGCTLGGQHIAEAFIKKGSRQYIGPEGYIEGNAALFFIIHFYYELITNQRLEDEAFKIARNTENETSLFRSYKRII